MREVFSGENILIGVPIREESWPAMREIINKISFFVFHTTFCYITSISVVQIQNIFSQLVVHDQLREVYVTREHKYHNLIKAKGADKCFMISSNPVGMRLHSCK